MGDFTITGRPDDLRAAVEAAAQADRITVDEVAITALKKALDSARSTSSRAGRLSEPERFRYWRANVGMLELDIVSSRNSPVPKLPRNSDVPVTGFGSPGPGH
jgi:hypothetical protein